jgi:hypothetical protein
VEGGGWRVEGGVVRTGTVLPNRRNKVGVLVSSLHKMRTQIRLSRICLP